MRSPPTEESSPLGDRSETDSVGRRDGLAEELPCAERTTQYLGAVNLRGWRGGGATHELRHPRLRRSLVGLER